MRTPNDTRGRACSQTLRARNEVPDAVEEYRALCAMTRAERIAGMWRGELTTRQRCRWSSRARHEIPILSGELAWIVMRISEWAEATDHAQASGVMATLTLPGADIPGYYHQLGIQPPERARHEASVRCFADSGAHRREDRNPSCSVNVINAPGQHRRPFCGAWCADHPARPWWQCFRGSTPSASPGDEAVHPHELSSPRQAEDVIARRRVMPTSSARNPYGTRRLSDASA
ncbi:MAG: hypothetical protein WBP81_01745 [Solirubrobacteraceae bacterium]